MVFKEGYIDRWTGDSINDPNRESKHQMRLNSFASYFRLNGKGDWLSRREFVDIISSLTITAETKTSDEIWNESLRIDQ